jgi:hypothetical protein
MSTRLGVVPAGLSLFLVAIAYAKPERRCRYAMSAYCVRAATNSTSGRISDISRWLWFTTFTPRP